MSERTGRALLLVGMLVFTIACAWRMERLCETGTTRHPQDLASINQAIWNSAHGNLLHATILRVGARDHLEPILIVYGLNYRLGGSIYSLMAVHAFLISLGAVPFYLLGRQRNLPVAESLLLSASYFLFPPLYHMMQSAWLRPVLLFFPALTTMAYAIVFSKPRWLIASVVLALFCKESAGITVFGLGIYLAFFERRWRVGGAVALLGAVWMPFVSFALLPWVSGMDVGHASRIRPCSLDILRRLTGKLWPVMVAAMVPCLLVMRRWAAVIGIPHMVGLLFFKTRLRYIIPIIPIPWFLAMDVLAGWRKVAWRRAFLVLLPVMMVTANIWLEYWEKLEPDTMIDAARPLMAMIPPDAAVCTNNRLLVHLSSRARIYEFNRRHRPRYDGRDYIDADYFLLTFSKEVRRPPFSRHRAAKNALEELQERGLELVAKREPWKLFRRTGRLSGEEKDDE